MFSKPFSLALVYILTIGNFIILVLPFLLAIFPFIDISGKQVVFAKYIAFNPKLALFWLVFLVSFLMLFYLFLDFLFGFSVRLALKDCQRYEKLRNYDFLEEIFGQVKAKFSSSSTKLYIKNSDEINAFAVGGARKKAIVLSAGLIEHYAQNTENNQEFLSALRSILGHEMSHLINKDYWPGLLIIVNQKITNLVGQILYLIFKNIIWLSTFLGLHNQRIAAIILSIYNISNWLLNCFNRYIIYNFYQFLKNFLSRATEYRCDFQSARAFGGINMAFALSLLGKSGYFTLFSTHPSTSRRIRKVEVIEEKNAIIRANFFNQLSNLISIIILPLICYYAAHLSKADLLIKFYLYYHHPDFYNQFLKLILTLQNLSYN